jgi:hypothetical protein
MYTSVMGHTQPTSDKDKQTILDDLIDFTGSHDLAMEYLEDIKKVASDPNTVQIGVRLHRI